MFNATSQECPPLRIDASFSLKNMVLEGIANEVLDAVQDVGPVSDDGAEEMERQYDLFYGTSPLPSPSPSPPLPPARPLSPIPAWDAPHAPPAALDSAAGSALLGGVYTDQPLQHVAGKPSRRRKRARDEPRTPTTPRPPPSAASPSASSREPPTAQPRSSKQRRNDKKSKRQRRRDRGMDCVEDVESTRAPKAFIEDKYVRNAEKLAADFRVQDIPCASTAYVAKPDGGRGGVHSLADLLSRGLKLVKWDGR